LNVGSSEEIARRLYEKLPLLILTVGSHRELCSLTFVLLRGLMRETNQNGKKEFVVTENGMRGEIEIGNKTRFEPQRLHWKLNISLL